MRENGRIRAFGGLAVMVGVLSVLLLVPIGRAGGDSPAQDVISAAEIKVENLSNAFYGRTQTTAARAFERLADADATMGDHMKVMGDAVAKIDKDARKTAIKIEQIAERTLERAIDLGADMSEVEQAEAIFETGDEVVNTSFEAAQALVALMENRYDFVP